MKNLEEPSNEMPATINTLSPRPKIKQQPKIIRKYDPNRIDVAVSLNVREQPENEIKLI